ncbi:MAG: gliding motility-associated C-terminal domain-containing protein [Flavobacteriales bacterium]|nr:gliding motility-associated C-terminal domain-containing protein [Flavobacteriales bacterium]MBK9289663.1 gliding motility-associated C-terminal domain-containing protein [Flavobacteriales bacterium]MBL0036444.1 gliding motility-associated C-terminal domain-containing protein [Flavobacteriales bacterium]
MLGAILLGQMVMLGHAQQILYINTSVGELVKVDAASCQTTVVGSTSTLLQDIAFTPDGRLWGVYGNSLYEIDPNDATTSFVGSMPGLSTNSLVAWNNDTLIGDYYGWLWGIRASDGYAWQIDSIAIGSSGDLTWYNGDLYMTTFAPDLVRISVNSNLTAVTSIVHVGMLSVGWGGGWLGANTLMLESDCGPMPHLIACVGPNVLEVSATDASISPVCANVISGISWGAASLSEFREVIPTASSISIPNVFSPNGDGVNDQLLPSPPDLVTHWTCSIYDRWGNLVRICGSQAWDGRSVDGTLCAEGTYFIVARLSSPCSPSVDVHSHVTLVR